MSASNTEELEAKIASLSEQIKALSDENVKTRRSNEDLMYNLDEDNIPMFRKVTDSINGIQSTITQQADKIALVVSGTGEDSSINAAGIVAAINSGASTVIISADHINLSGYITATDLSTSGSTTINGDNITTGHISASYISANASRNGSSWIQFTSPMWITDTNGALSNSWGIINNGNLYGAFVYDSVGNVVQLWTQTYPLSIQSAAGIQFENRPKVLINGSYYNVLTTNDTITAVFG